MATKGDNPPVGLTPQGILVETFGTHISSTKIDPILLLPLENFPYVSNPYHLTIRPSAPPSYCAPLVPPGYKSLDDDFYDNSSETSLFHNPI